MFHDLPQKLDIQAAEKHSVAWMLHHFENSPKPIRPITKHLASASGKSVRASLLLTVSMDENGFVPKESILAATAVELFHLATLVHDDVIDEASTRRGISSVHVKFSKKEAIICGDYLFCVALSALSAIYDPYKDYMSKFANAVEKVCLGELRQYSNNFNADIGFFEYLRIIRGKTASLFYVSAYAGALLGNLSEKEVNLMGKLGTYIGMIFQILDDCKDYMLNESEALKPTKADIATGVVNLPLLMAFIKEPSLREVAKSAMKNPIEIINLIDDVHRLNGVEDSLSVARKYIKKSTEIVKSINNKRKSEELEKLLSKQMLVMEGFVEK